MHCPHCKSVMAETERSTDQGSEQVRFECPVCSSVALSIRPLVKNAGNAYPQADPISGRARGVAAPGGRQFRF